MPRKVGRRRWLGIARWTEDRRAITAGAETGSVDCNSGEYAVALWSKTRAYKTADPKEAERARGDLEADLNAGRHQQASRMSWEAFRDLFEAEFLLGVPDAPMHGIDQGIALCRQAADTFGAEKDVPSHLAHPRKCSISSGDSPSTGPSQCTKVE